MAKKAIVAPKTFRFKLGKTQARRGAVKFKLAKYLVQHKLPTPPKVFGHQALVRTWGVLANDEFQDCVWAGAAHETMLWNKEANKTAKFNDNVVLKDYAKVTGFNRNDLHNTDKGTDMQVAASYRRKTGVLAANGKRHKVKAYLALSPGNVDQLVLAIYLFGAVGIGFKFPDSARTQFDAGKPWEVTSGPPPKKKDTHYVPGVGRDSNGNIIVVTWGKLQRMTPKFYKKYCDEVIAYVSEEMLVPPTEVTLEGLKLEQLLKDLGKLK
jgi:hypothetical protein